MGKLYLCRRAKYRLGLYDKGKTAKNRFLLRIFIVIILITVLSVGGLSKIGSLAVKLGASRLSNDITAECNKIAAELLSESDITYETAISESRNSENAITSLSADFTEINLLKAAVSQRVAEYLNSLSRIKCGVPAGAVLSNDIMTGWGFDIPACIAVSGSVYAEFCDDFVSAGINQTKHRLMLRVTVDAQIHGAFCTEQHRIICDIPLTETVIVGEASGILMQKSVDY